MRIRIEIILSKKNSFVLLDKPIPPDFANVVLEHVITSLVDSLDKIYGCNKYEWSKKTHIICGIPESLLFDIKIIKESES